MKRTFGIIILFITRLRECIVDVVAQVLKRTAHICGFDPPPLKWSSAMVKKTEETHGKQATEARRDYHETAAS